MRRRTAILLCLAVVSVGAGAYFVIGALSGDEPAKAGAPARATSQAATGAPAAFADDRPILERGTREPDLITLLRYAKAGRVTVERLIDDELDLP